MFRFRGDVVQRFALVAENRSGVSSASGPTLTQICRLSALQAANAGIAIRGKRSIIAPP